MRHVILMTIGIFILTASLIYGIEGKSLDGGQVILGRMAVERVITYQGILKDNSGNPVGDGNYNLTFRLYNLSSGGSLLWTSPVTPVTTSDGYFGTILGPIALRFDSTYYLSVQVQGDAEMTQRQRLTITPYSASSDTANYAFRADTALFAIGGSAGGWIDNGTAVRLATITDSVGIGTTTPSQKLHVEGNLFVSGKATIGGSHVNTANWTFVSGVGDTVTADYSVVQGYGNAASGSRATVSGGSGNKANANWSTVSGGTGNFATGATSTVGGGWSNTAAAQRATVSGGQANYAEGSESAVGGGHLDSTKAIYGAIMGGYSNLAGDDVSDTAAFVGGGYQNHVSVKYGAVGGGLSNNARGEYSYVGGGRQNSTDSIYSVCVGGYWNDVSAGSALVGGSMNNAMGSSSFVGGGSLNDATANSAVVTGGLDNTASGDYAVISGGRSNDTPAIYSSVTGGRLNNAGNDAADTAAFVGGGYSNYVSAGYGTIAGGNNNDATNNCATIAGGYVNLASGMFSFIGGGKEDTASGYASVIGGGDSNAACSTAATVAGGYINRAMHHFATVGGGGSNTAGGVYSVVCGGDNNVNNGNRCVILGGEDNSIGSNGEMSIAFGRDVSITNTYRAAFFEGTRYGFFGINRDDGNGGITNPIHVGTNASNGNGAYLSAGGVWNNGSSRTFKENFISMPGEELLSKISRLSITSYNYKNSAEKHIGPVAEEFVEAFDTGIIRESDGKRDDMYLSSGDVAGVALAGVRELLKKIEVLEKRIAELEAEKK